MKGERKLKYIIKSRKRWNSNAEDKQQCEGQTESSPAIYFEPQSTSVGLCIAG